MISAVCQETFSGMKIHKNFTKITFSYAIILLILRMILGNTAQSLCVRCVVAFTSAMMHG
ncbi:hypothetical protein RUMCAL_02719 [Ruminococcus callidus ATCC 27760]|uniref:Uncharacterized protein n=1 Tax=Ruminococcus callidus ATCC 27760 TaxID=411473 RepID=U2LUW1_9FIRM|nr:hypothetical protein RUMCAL_02719 [Ruminococcus callidus ATCC 27760]